MVFFFSGISGCCPQVRFTRLNAGKDRLLTAFVAGETGR